MAISFPRDIPSCAGFKTHRFVLVRSQSFAMAGGSPQAVDIAPPRWEATYSLDTLTRADTAAWEAWLDSLRGRLRTFKGRPPGHRWLMSRPTGYTGLTYDSNPWTGIGNLDAISEQRDAITIDEIPNGIVVQPGDFLSFAMSPRQHLHRVTEGATSASNKVTVSIEPTIRPDVTVDRDVTLASPWCDMVLADDPDISGALHKRASISFKGVQLLK